MIHSLAMSAKIAVMAAVTGQTMAATAAQVSYNGALYACPIVWIIMLIIALGIVKAIAALASNMMTAFHNAICSVQSWFYNLLSTALSVIAGICEALNRLLFVEFDYSGITSAADDYAAKAAEAVGNKEDYTSISDAFNNGMSTFDAFQDGWVSDAFKAGAAWGDGITDKLTGLLDVFLGGGEDFHRNNLLDEKIEVLTVLVEGKHPSGIPQYYDILELYPKEREGVCIHWD